MCHGRKYLGLVNSENKIQQAQSQAIAVKDFSVFTFTQL
jgi:hypothetical protein